MTSNDLVAIAPELVLAGTLLAVLVLDAFLPTRRAWLAMPLSLLGVLGALGATLAIAGSDRSAFGGTFVVDHFAILFKVFFLAVAVVVLALSYRHLREGRYHQGEYYFLLLTAFLGCSMMPSARDLLVLFISLELVSAPGFLMAAFRKGDPRSNEAGLKFFLLGVLSTAVMLYGISLIYGVTGSLGLAQVGAALAGSLPEGTAPVVAAAVLMVITGFAFKISAVPFQFWAPDTYEGAPVPVAAFLATASKAAGFAGLLQLLFVAFPAQHAIWAPVFAVITALTMTLGNVVALQQRQAVRLLAYSSIAQAGYIMLPFALVSGDAALNADAFSAATTYILIYAIMTLGAFAVVTVVARGARGLLIEDFAGLGRRAPVLAIAMTVCMISLAGIPPMGGFWGKFLIFKVAIEAGGIGPWLAGLMVVNSVISLAYYLAIPRQMMFADGAGRPEVGRSRLATLVAVAAVLGVLVVGAYPQLLAGFPQVSTLVAP